MKYVAPEGASGITIASEEYKVDKKGHVSVPDETDPSLMASHGYTAAPTNVQESKSSKKAEQAEAEKLAAEQVEAEKLAAEQAEAEQPKE